MRSSLNASAVDYAFLQTQGVHASEVSVRLITPSILLSERLPRAVVTIDYVNIDVEQQELAILRTWPFHRFCVRLFNIENEPPKGEPSYLPQMMALLKPHGYAHQLRIGVDEVFTRTTPCPEPDGVASGSFAGASGSFAGRAGGRRRTLLKRRLALGKARSSDSSDGSRRRQQ